NAELRQRVTELDQELSSARTGGGGGQPTQAIPLYQPEPEPEPAPQPTYEAPPTPAPAPAQPAAPQGEEAHLKAARVLALAQDTADRLTGTAKAEADKLLADARA